MIKKNTSHIETVHLAPPPPVENEKDFLTWLITSKSDYINIAGLSIKKTRNSLGEMVAEIVIPYDVERAVKWKESQGE